MSESEKGKCGNCNWWRSEVCTNYKSDERSGFTLKTDGCKNWEQAEAIPADKCTYRKVMTALCPRCEAVLTNDPRVFDVKGKGKCKECGNEYTYPATAW